MIAALLFWGLCGSVRSLQRCFPIDDVLLRSGDIRDQVEVVRNRAEILMFLGRQISGEMGQKIYKSGSPSKM